jgi:hypothetical protein
MEGLLLIIPIVISLGNCLSYCFYAHTTNRRLDAIENVIKSLRYPPQAPSPSAPPYEYTQVPSEYGYQQNLNVI